MEMMLHHTVTIYLLVGSYLYNVWECGAIISFIHDASDIFAHFTKAIGQTTLDIITIPAFIMMMGVWFYLRNIMLPFCIYHSWHQGMKQHLFEHEGLFGYSVTLPIYCYLLSLLVILHYYWFSMFCQMIYKAISEGDTEDRQNDMSKDIEKGKDEKKE